MENNKKEHIYVIWKDPESRKRFKIGNLIRNNKYIFEYDLKETYQAMKYGFEPFVAFPDINEVYSHNDLFLTFLCRLPDRRRADINEILKNYGMDKFDAFELLLRSGGRLPTDTLEFIKPIFIEESNIIRYFFVAGTRHYDICDKNTCKKNIKLNIGDKLLLEREPDNDFDKNAVIIFSEDKTILGYVPNYYCKPVSKAIMKNRNIECVVRNINQTANCQECIKVKLTIE